MDGERYGVDQTLARVDKFFAVAEGGARCDLAAPDARSHLPWRVRHIEAESSEAVAATVAALTGLPAGVTVSQLSGGPGGGPIVRWTCRGRSTRPGWPSGWTRPP